MEKGFSKTDILKFFPKSYKHTIGHWFRDDMGGSIPQKQDWLKLASVLDIDESFTNYVCKRGLKLQTVQNSSYKVPDDFLPAEKLTLLKQLIKTTQSNTAPV